MGAKPNSHKRSSAPGFGSNTLHHIVRTKLKLFNFTAIFTRVRSPRSGTSHTAFIAPQTRGLTKHDIISAIIDGDARYFGANALSIVLSCSREAQRRDPS